MARRNFTSRENEIVFAGARAGLARTRIVEQLHAEGFNRDPQVLRTASSYVAGRQAADEAAKRANLIKMQAAHAAPSRASDRADRVRVNGVSLPRLTIQAGWSGDAR